MIDVATSKLDAGELVIISPVPGAYAGMPVELPKEVETSKLPATEATEPVPAAQG